MNKFFEIFGKIALILVLVGGVAYGAYSFGKGSFTPSGFGGVTTTKSPEATPTELPPFAVATPTPNAGTRIAAGLDASSGLSFTKYQISVSPSWTPTHVTTNEGTWTDTLTLTHASGGTVKFFQGATGGAMCLYPDDADAEGPSSRYDTFVELKTSDGVSLRRGWTTGSEQNSTVCQKSSDGSWGQPTVFGHVSVKLGSFDSATLTAVDEMIRTLKKQ